MKHSDIFVLNTTELRKTELMSYHTGDHPPIRQPLRTTPFSLRKRVNEIVKEILGSGYTTAYIVLLATCICGHHFRNWCRGLSHIVSEEGVRTDPKKPHVVSDYHTLTDVKSLRSSLGLVLYHCRFIPSFAKTVGPLYTLTKKDVE